MAATNYSQTIKNDTKDFITTVILQLLGIQKTSEKPKTLAQLTVSNVCQRAGVSRMAFYRNFDSINSSINTINHEFPKALKSFARMCRQQ